MQIIRLYAEEESTPIATVSKLTNISDMFSLIENYCNATLTPFLRAFNNIFETRVLYKSFTSTQSVLQVHKYTKIHRFTRFRNVLMENIFHALIARSCLK